MAWRTGRCMACGEETEIGDVGCKNTSVCKACFKGIQEGGITKYRVHYDGNRSRLRIQCECGLEVVCYGFTNTCDCGRDYDMGGSLLAPRSQWGADTGESVSEILSVDARTTEELLG